MGRMRRTGDESAEGSRIMLGLLAAVEQDRAQSQRLLASELGIALGLVNAYLRRCVKKGLVKVTQVPARRYMYYLTPIGFAEKSRLTVEYLSVSLGFFRQAKAECSALFASASARGLSRIAFAGISDLAEIAMICALNGDIKIIAIVDGKAAVKNYMGVPVVASFADLPEACDAVLITDL